MKSRILKNRDVLKVVDALRARGYQVLAPFCSRGQDTCFDTVTDANRAEIQLHVRNPFYPPKRFVLPHIERMMKFHQADRCLEVVSTDEQPLRAIFGIRSCDIAGIWHLDRFYLGRDFRDPYYQERRRNLFLINFACTDPARDISDDCFCVCTDTGPAARDHFDLQLMDLGDDEFMAVAGTPVGETLFAEPFFSRGNEQHVRRRREILGEARRHFKTATSWFPAAVRYISQGKVLDKTWEQIGNRCMECGGCTYVCPACTCFTVTDRVIGQNEAERVRIWDSCALAGFTRMAGGFNPRRAVHDRRNRRFFRKLAQYFIQRELSMACVGCGRCVSVCHGDIGMPSVVEMLRRTTVKSEQHEQAVQ